MELVKKTGKEQLARQQDPRAKRKVFQGGDAKCCTENQIRIKLAGGFGKIETLPVKH